MDFTCELKQRRVKLEKLITEKKLEAAVLAGNSCIGNTAFSTLRYFTDWRCYFSLQAMISVPGKEPIMCVGSVLHRQGLTERGFSDIRDNAPVIVNIIRVLKQESIKSIGVCTEVFPADWYLALKKEIPDIAFTDISEDIYKLRTDISDEALARTRRSAEIADEGFSAVCDIAKPGVKMMELHAELDHVLYRAGAEETFTLMSNGRFSYTDNKLGILQRFSYPDDRIVVPGDNIAMQIAPRYKGYWTQLVRTVCIGDASDDFKEAQTKSAALINEAAECIVPGVTFGDVMSCFAGAAENTGYAPVMPLARITGLDLDESGIMPAGGDVVLKENMTVVINPVIGRNGIPCSIYHGDSFIVTPDGGKRISKTTSDIVIL